MGSVGREEKRRKKGIFVGMEIRIGFMRLRRNRGGLKDWFVIRECNVLDLDKNMSELELCCVGLRKKKKKN